MSLNLPLAFGEFVQSGLIIDELKHGLVAAPFAALLHTKTKSIKKFFIFYFLVFALDTDHFIDFWLYKGINLDLFEFMKLDYFKITGRAIVLFHAWEWAILFSILTYKKGWNSPFAIIALAIFAHVSWDMIGISSPAFYSIIYRSHRGFLLP